MKRKDTKIALSKFSKRQTHKRRQKSVTDKILNEIAATGVGFEAVKLKSTTDGGRRGRTMPKPGRDEVRAEGIFSGTKSGFGFVSISPDDSERDIFIPEGKCGSAIDGDAVEVVYHKYKNYTGEEKTEGRITKVIKPGRDIIVGTIEPERVGRRYGRISQRMVFIADDPRISVLPIVRDTAGAKSGEKVAVRIKRGTGTPYNPDCEVVAVLGDPESREANYEAVLLESGIPTEFSPEELAEAERSAAMEIDYSSRLDLRGEVIFTIDGAGAKDLDDAVSLTRDDEGYLLGVHIADVSHYVAERTPLDRATMARGTSVYFVDKVVPMLPPVLSNGACSLGADEDKCTLSALIRLDNDGAISSVDIRPAVIRSRVRGVYSEVNAILDGTADKDITEKYSSVREALAAMRELYLLLAERAKKRGMLELDLPEAYIALDEQGSPIDIRPAVRGDAEKMIEQFMLTANEAVAARLRREGVPCVYRVHEYPPEEKLRELLSYSKNLGLDISGIPAEKPSPGELSHLLREAEERGIYAPVSYFLLRSMAKAKYAASPDGHFGLGLADYCHFTSPIRRLSDLATHRIIHRVLIDGKTAGSYASYARRAAAAATDTELRAVGAERRIENIYKAIYMKDKEGSEFSGVVSSVASFGMFVMLENTCEGLVPIDDMPGYFVYDEKNLSLRCSDAVYRVGDRVRVRLEESDLVKCKLRFSIIL